MAREGVAARGSAATRTTTLGRVPVEQAEPRPSPRGSLIVVGHWSPWTKSTSRDVTPKTRVCSPCVRRTPRGSRSPPNPQGQSSGSRQRSNPASAAPRSTPDGQTPTPPDMRDRHCPASLALPAARRPGSATGTKPEVGHIMRTCRHSSSLGPTGGRHRTRGDYRPPGSRPLDRERSERSSTSCWERNRPQVATSSDLRVRQAAAGRRRFCAVRVQPERALPPLFGDILVVQQPSRVCTIGTTLQTRQEERYPPCRGHRRRLTVFTPSLRRWANAEQESINEPQRRYAACRR